MSERPPQNNFYRNLAIAAYFGGGILSADFFKRRVEDGVDDGFGFDEAGLFVSFLILALPLVYWAMTPKK
ncbi:MAG: hypothetical protein ACJKTH_03085 [Patescibacteria group bacterium UBA2163]